MNYARTQQLLQSLGAPAPSQRRRDPIGDGSLNKNVFSESEDKRGLNPQSIQGLNKAVGERVYGVKGKGLVNENWFGGGFKPVGQAMKTVGNLIGNNTLTNAGNYVVNSGYFSGDPVKFVGQAVTDAGNSALGNTISNASPSELYGKAIDGTLEGLKQAYGIGQNIGSTLMRGASSIGDSIGSAMGLGSAGTASGAATGAGAASTGSAVGGASGAASSGAAASGASSAGSAAASEAGASSLLDTLASFLFL